MSSRRHAARGEHPAWGVLNKILASGRRDALVANAKSGKSRPSLPAEFADPTADGSCPNTGLVLVATILRVFLSQTFPSLVSLVSSSFIITLFAVSFVAFPLLHLHLRISLIVCISTIEVASSARLTTRRPAQKRRVTSGKYPPEAPAAPGKSYLR
ncbi:hypothetical protein CCMA1212_010196 [Trichoderma ghanense]|uniref:Uncharacterized protein n=1 Tax=Trichoderma ghanense TaxID=65468 RepID=A0ABY2GRE9_9HYPO